MSTVFVVEANIDQNIRVSTLPRAGETVRGSDATYSPGGKGGNQAVAAARAGAAVTFTGAVGTTPMAGGFLRSSPRPASMPATFGSAAPPPPERRSSRSMTRAKTRSS